MNPLGVRWGRSDSERCSPPSSFPSVHLLTTFPFFTPLMWISPLTFHLFALKRVFSGEFPHLSTTFLSPSAICVQRDTSTFCSSWSTTGFQNHQHCYSPYGTTQLEKTGKKGSFGPRKAPFGALEVLGGPRGGRFDPNYPRLARLGWIHGHHTL